MALDLGEVRTGVAVSDPGATIARPLEVVPSQELSGYLGSMVLEGVAEVLVGVPKTLGGEVGFQARRSLGTISALKKEFPAVRFVEWDERFTTRIAASGVTRKKRRHKKGAKDRLDHLAAARMLQEYLDARGAVEEGR
ncbi:MAG: Holliday junction resolvase RuvX [Rubrobacteraceae bacterium]